MKPSTWPFCFIILRAAHREKSSNPSSLFPHKEKTLHEYATNICIYHTVFRRDVALFLAASLIASEQVVFRLSHTAQSRQYQKNLDGPNNSRESGLCLFVVHHNNLERWNQKQAGAAIRVVAHCSDRDGGKKTGLGKTSVGEIQSHEQGCQGR